MEIIKIPLSDLTPDPHNAKDHPQWQIEQIKNSIEQFGNLDPIGVWGDDNLIVEGHGRYEALKELGYQEAECIRLDWLTEEERKAYALAHNKLTMNSGFIPDALDMTLAAIGEIDMSQFGFEIPEEEEPAEITEDEIPEEVETRCKLGDIWQLGDHRLICGDSTDPAVIDRLMMGGKADTYIWDPPFEKEELYDLIPKNDGGRLFVFSDYKHFAKAIIGAINKKWQGRFEFIWDCCQSWYTPNRPLARHKTCYVFGDAEKWDFDNAIIHDGKKREEEEGTNTRGDWHWVPLNGAVHMRTVEQFPNTAQHDENGYGKPVKWIAALLQGYGGENVIDPFGGSGSTLIACEQLNRKCYMCELDERYASIIVNRWLNFTGRKDEIFCIRDGQRLTYDEVFN